jgi:hypothetical protein
VASSIAMSLKKHLIKCVLEAFVQTILMRFYLLPQNAKVEYFSN